MHLPENKRNDDVEKKIDMAEVDLEKRRAQLEATSRMLKRRAKVFLNKFTPHVTDAVRAFTLCQHRARLENAELLENVVAADRGTASHRRTLAREVRLVHRHRGQRLSVRGAGRVRVLAGRDPAGERWRRDERRRRVKEPSNQLRRGGARRVIFGAADGCIHFKKLRIGTATG